MLDRGISICGFVFFCSISFYCCIELKLIFIGLLAAPCMRIRTLLTMDCLFCQSRERKFMLFNRRTLIKLSGFIPFRDSFFFWIPDRKNHANLISVRRLNNMIFPSLLSQNKQSIVMSVRIIMYGAANRRMNINFNLIQQ